METAPATVDTPLPAEVLATLTEIGEGVNSSLDLDEVLARTAALIKRHIDYEIFGVLMLEGDGAYSEASFFHWLPARPGGKRARAAGQRDYRDGGGHRPPCAGE